MDKEDTLERERTVGEDSNSYAADGETGVAPRRTFGQKLKAHFRRWWWLWLIVFCAVVLIIVLPLIYVGVPNIGQGDINDSSLEMVSQNVSDPKADSVHMSIVTEAHSDSMYHPKLDSFNASLFLEDTEPNIVPFGYITIPAVQVKKDTQIVVDQDMPIANMEQFMTYTAVVMGSETFRVAIRGKTKFKQSGLPKFSVNYNKVITMKGLNKLAGFTINADSLSLQTADSSDGTNLVGTVTIPNPSVMTLALGTVVMNLSVNGTAIGYATLANLTLAPGTNTVDMRTVADEAAILGLLGTYTDYVLPLTIVGNSSTNAAGERLRYYEAAIKANVMQVDLNVTHAMSGLLGKRSVALV